MHPHETVLRAAYDAFGRGDIPGFLAVCTADVTFDIPGDGLLSGHLTKDAFLAKLGPAMQAVAGTFREEVAGMTVSDDAGAVLTAQRAERDGALHTWHSVHWWRFRDGKLAELREFVDDAAAFGRAWHR
jgi:ketosteroid isomerase-like protein